MKTRNIFRLIILLVAMAAAKPGFAVTAAQVLKTASDKALKAKGITCNFSLLAGGRHVNGTLKAAGKKFTVTTPMGSSWYNGKDLATYNPSTKETTIVLPTSEELAETNPLLYLNSYASAYTASFEKNMPKTKYVIQLTPKSRKTAVKKVVVTLNSKTYMPEKIVVTGSDNRNTTVNISGINYNTPLSATAFEYPKSKYPKAEIIDLR